VAPAQPSGSAIANPDQERLLVESLRAREDAAWSRLYDDNFERLYVYALVRLRDPGAAEDAAAQVFVEAIRGIGKYHYRGVPVRAWLYAIAHNVVVDAVKRRAKRGEVPLLDSLDTAGRERELGLGVDFLKAMATLTDEQQQVIALRFVQDLPVAEVAVVMKRSEGAVKMLQLRALAALRREMSAE
jgi:RNA polymerase sigma-70 factor, ECF subfamily